MMVMKYGNVEGENSDVNGNDDDNVFVDDKDDDEDDDENLNYHIL